ncbi:MAG: NAD(P)H-dependent glycerol-3-phosphate dehydrogenase, partial [Halanaerobiales bacterium]
LIVSTAKGIEEDTYLRNSQIISNNCNNPVAILSGPTHAEEVINNLPTAAVVASKNKAAAKEIQELMMSAKFRVYTNPDIIGVELGGAIKNIMAIAAGIADGLSYGDNTKAALVTRGLHEMSRLGVSMGGSLLTYAGLTGMGDLVVTCTSLHSRNRRLGIKIGQGYTLKQAQAQVKQTVEGIRTTKAIYKWYKEGDYSFDIPITKQIYQVLFEEKDPLKAVDDLMLRGAKHEIAEVVEALDW